MKLKLELPSMRLITVDYESELFNYHRTSSNEGWAPIERVQVFLCERTVKGLNPGVFSLFLCDLFWFVFPRSNIASIIPRL